MNQLKIELARKYIASQKKLELQILVPPKAMRQLRQLAKKNNTTPNGLLSLALLTSPILTSKKLQPMSIESDN
jgi:hypothetical protein